jgi:hypothetical protein
MLGLYIVLGLDFYKGKLGQGEQKHLEVIVGPLLVKQ